MMLTETERLIIKTFDESMAQAVHELSVDENNRRFQPDEVFEGVDQRRSDIEREVVEIRHRHMQPPDGVLQRGADALGAAADGSVQIKQYILILHGISRPLSPEICPP